MAMAMVRDPLAAGRASLALAALLCSGLAVSQTVEEPRSVTVTAGDMVTYDDNLYRLPSAHTPYRSLLNPGSSVADYLNSVSAGVNGLWSLGRQAFDLRVKVSNNDYLRNTALDNVSNTGKLVWNWQLGNQLAGQLGGDYSRSLADFANTLFYSKDIIATTDYFGKAAWELGPHWSVKGLVSHSVTSHTNAERAGDDYEARSGEFGIEYAMSAVDTVTLNYEYTYADFRQEITFNDQPFNRNYDDNKYSLNLKYALTAATSLDATAGYLERKYPNRLIGTPPIGNFSGDVWNISLRWQPTVQSGIKLSGWRDLRAYLDAESNYFVSRGGTIAPIWSPIEALEVSLAFSYESQSFISAGTTPASVAARSDRLRTDQVLVTYKPYRVLQLDLSYKYEARTSDQMIYEYKDKLASLAFRLIF